MATDTKLQDQRKRTLDALERRFAVAKAELLHQQGKKNKKSDEGDERVPHGNAAPSDRPTETPITSHLNTSSKKDLEASGPTYLQLSHHVHENLLTVNDKISQGKDRIKKIWHELLQNGDSSQKYMQGSKSIKIDDVILLDNYVRGRPVSAGSRIRALRQNSKRSKIHTSMKKHKKLGSFNLPQEFQKFETVKHMYETWHSIIMKPLENSTKNQLAQNLLDANLHGAMVLVVECGITAFVGLHGIVVLETAETFRIVSEDDKVRVVPKRNSVFRLQVGCWKITLLGDKLRSRDLPL